MLWHLKTVLIKWGLLPSITMVKHTHTYLRCQSALSSGVLLLGKLMPPDPSGLVWLGSPRWNWHRGISSSSSSLYFWEPYFWEPHYLKMVGGKHQRRVSSRILYSHKLLVENGSLVLFSSYLTIFPPSPSPSTLFPFAPISHSPITFPISHSTSPSPFISIWQWLVVASFPGLTSNRPGNEAIAGCSSAYITKLS